MSILSLSRITRLSVWGVCMALHAFSGCSDREIRGALPDSEMVSLQDVYWERLKPLQTAPSAYQPMDAKDFHDFVWSLRELASRYTITQSDIRRIMGDPSYNDSITYEFEYMYPGYTHEKNSCILVWFDQHFNVGSCFSTIRPKEKYPSDEVKKRLKMLSRELLLPIGGKSRMGSTEVDRRVKKMKNAFKEIVKSVSLTYQDVVSILGRPTGSEMEYENCAYLGGFGYTLTIEYHFPLNDTAYSALCFVFYETLGGCLGVVDTSWGSNAR